VGEVPLGAGAQRVAVLFAGEGYLRLAGFALKLRLKRLQKRTQLQSEDCEDCA
jgi:hypothetical protein